MAHKDALTLEFEYVEEAVNIFHRSWNSAKEADESADNYKQEVEQCKKAGNR